MNEDDIQAFPGPHNANRDGSPVYPQYRGGGMTLRDYFAARALQGMHSRDTFDPGQATPQQRAKSAYIDADAMLEARK